MKIDIPLQRPWVDIEAFIRCRKHAALTRERAAELVGVTPRTVRNWETGRTSIPYAAFELLRVKTGASLPYPGFEDWECRDGVLISPAGDAFTAGGLTWLSLTFAMAREWQRERGLLPAKPDLSDPPRAHVGGGRPPAGGNPSSLPGLPGREDGGRRFTPTTTNACDPSFSAQEPPVCLHPPSSNTGGKSLPEVTEASC